MAQTHSRELGVFVSEVSNHGAPIAKNEVAVAKSWAHFVAGGYGAPSFCLNGANNI